MSDDGYAPYFGGRTVKGSLCGKWPDIGLWGVILGMKDRHGVLDCTPAFIAFTTGLPVDEVIACMRRFCAPDPMSRSKVHAGARLVLLEPDARDWGWRFVNHEYYRELARLRSKNAQETAERKSRGRDTDGDRRPPPVSAGIRRSPPETAAGRPSDADADADADADSDSGRELFPAEPLVGTPRGAPRQASNLPDDFSLTPARRAVAEAEHVDPDRTFAKFCDHWRAASGQRARKRDWDATWRNWCRTEADRSRGINGKDGHETRFDRAQRRLKA